MPGFFIAFLLSLYSAQADLFIVRPVISPLARQNRTNKRTKRPEGTSPTFLVRPLLVITKRLNIAV